MHMIHPRVSLSKSATPMMKPMEAAYFAPGPFQYRWIYLGLL